MTDAVELDSTAQERDHTQSRTPAPAQHLADRIPLAAEVLERVRTLEVRLARHFAAIELQERQRGQPAVPRHEYGDGSSWCHPEAIVLRREALEAEIEAVVAGGSPRTVTPLELAALTKVTGRLAVELVALNLREPAVLRTYAEWVIEALTTPRKRLSPKALRHFTAARQRSRSPRRSVVELRGVSPAWA